MNFFETINTHKFYFETSIKKGSLDSDYFDYLDDNNKKQQYDPDSDMDFIDFKKTMMTEWEKYSPNNKGFFSCFK